MAAAQESDRELPWAVEFGDVFDRYQSVLGGAGLWMVNDVFDNQPVAVTRVDMAEDTAALGLNFKLPHSSRYDIGLPEYVRIEYLANGTMSEILCAERPRAQLDGIEMARLIMRSTLYNARAGQYRALTIFGKRLVKMEPSKVGGNV